MKQKLIAEASKKSRKGEEDGEDSINKEAGHGVNLKTSKKGKKKKKKKKKVINEAPTGEEPVVEDIGGADSDGTETDVGDEMDDGDHLEMEKQRQKKRKNQRAMGIEDLVPGQYCYHIKC